MLGLDYQFNDVQAVRDVSGILWVFAALVTLCLLQFQAACFHMKILNLGRKWADGKEPFFFHSSLFIGKESFFQVSLHL